MTMPLNHASELQRLLAQQAHECREVMRVSPYLRNHEANASDRAKIRAHVDTRGPGFVVIEGDR